MGDKLPCKMIMLQLKKIKVLIMAKNMSVQSQQRVWSSRER